MKKIEIGQLSKKRMTYDEALMYCMFHTDTTHGTIGWRIPSKSERCLRLNRLEIDDYWFEGAESRYKRYVLPVRTVNE